MLHSMVATVAMLMFFPPVVPGCQALCRKWLFQLGITGSVFLIEHHREKVGVGVDADDIDNGPLSE
jgi:hypothetical protein